MWVFNSPTTLESAALESIAVNKSCIWLSLRVILVGVEIKPNDSEKIELPPIPKPISTPSTGASKGVTVNIIFAVDSNEPSVSPVRTG